MSPLKFQKDANVAVIPARAGSKGIPRKCLSTVKGKPLLQRAIEHANRSRQIQRVIVSTDDREFADLAVRWGAEVPFLRPPEFAQDNSSTVDAVLHLLNTLGCEVLPEFTVLIQPTTPLLLPEDIDGAFGKLEENVDAVASVCECEVNPDWMRRIGPNNWLEPVFALDVPQHTPRQVMPVTYRLNGAVYICRTSVFVEKRTFLPQRTVPFVMPVDRSVDIDNDFDLRVTNFIAETIVAE